MSNRSLISSYLTEYRRYRETGERALTQLSDGAINGQPLPGINSAAMVVRHLGGNLLSRFTDFLTSDGEKPWRDRDAEFLPNAYTRAEMNRWWEEGWETVEREVAALTDEELTKEVLIRGKSLSVNDALARSLAHVAYHVGQLVLLARLQTGAEWDWISIPPGQSQQYNANPTKEKKPA